MIEKTFVQKAIKKLEMEKFLKKELSKAGFVSADIVKTPLVTRIIVNVTKPGLAIGKSGQNIKQLTEIVEKEFGIENPQIEIKQIENPKLNAQAMVDEFLSAIEHGASWRSYAYRMVNEIMAAGAQGVELIIKGKLAGKGGRKKKVRIAAGYMKKIGDQVKNVDFAKGAVYPKAGAIGVRLRIVKPDVLFPDKINVTDYIEKAKAAAEEKSEQILSKENNEKNTVEKNEKKKTKEKKSEKKEKNENSKIEMKEAA